MYKISKVKFKYFNYFLFTALFLSFSLLTYSASGENRLFTQNELEIRLKSILKNPVLTPAFTSVSVVYLNDKKTLFSYQSKKPLKVASNMKLLTTATAINYLGPNFKYKTCVYLNGKFAQNGTLKGDIIIKGNGDPNISGRLYDGNVTAIPEMWADAIEGVGIKTVEGDIIADDTIFDREYVNPTWPKGQLSKWYCAQVSGLSFNDNCIDVIISPGKNDRQLVQATTNPQTNYVKIINSCKTTDKKSKHAYSLFRKEGSNEIHLKGYFWKGVKQQKEWVTIDKPSLYLAAVFKEIVEKRSIGVKGVVRFANEQDTESTKHWEDLICTFSTIEQTINVTNNHSQNFYAEQILKTLGANSGKKGSFTTGIEVMKDMLGLLGHEKAEFEIADGSGLSQKNRLTTEIFTDLLCYMHKHKDGQIFIDSLPVSGIKGTLKNRLINPPYKAKIKAKTGYILGVSALSGYAETLSGDILAFSILINDFKVSNRTITKIQDSICMALVNYCGDKH